MGIDRVERILISHDENPLPQHNGSDNRMALCVKCTERQLFGEGKMRYDRVLKYPSMIDGPTFNRGAI